MRAVAAPRCVRSERLAGALSHLCIAAQAGSAQPPPGSRSTARGKRGLPFDTGAPTQLKTVVQDVPVRRCAALPRAPRSPCGWQPQEQIFARTRQLLMGAHAAPHGGRPGGGTGCFICSTGAATTMFECAYCEKALLPCPARRLVRPLTMPCADGVRALHAGVCCLRGALLHLLLH